MKYCGAKKRQGTGTCTRPAGWGTEHVGYGTCKLHGGKTRSGKVAAERQQAEEAVVLYGLPREVDPHAALLEELHRAAGHVAWLGGLVAHLSDDLTQQQHLEAGGTVERPSVWLELYQRERTNLGRIAKTCVDVGIEERRVTLAEQQGQLIAQVLRGVLTDLGVADHPEAQEVVRKHLTLVSDAAA